MSRYNVTGVQVWSARYNGGENGDDRAFAIVVDISGNVYVTGTSGGAASWTIYTTIKYCQGSFISSVKTTPVEVPAAFELEANYPNPFWIETTSPARSGGNPETTIQYAIPARVGDGGEHVTLRIYNLHGQLVRTLVDAPQLPGRHRVVWDGKNGAGASVSSGVYLYTITAGHFKAAKKLTILN